MKYKQFLKILEMGALKNFLLVYRRDFIISGRFLATTGHLILIIMIFFSKVREYGLFSNEKDNNIRAHYGRDYSSTDFHSASTS